MNEYENGEPRYRVSRLTKRRLFARYGVFAGTGTMPIFETYRFHLALRIQSVAQVAYSDGHYVGSGAFASTSPCEHKP